MTAMGNSAGISDARRLVRITGTRNGLVEFEYGVGDLALAIELMLPPSAFDEFCTANRVEIIEVDARDAMSADERSMAWRPSDVQKRI